MEPAFHVARANQNTIRIKARLPEEQCPCLKEAAKTGVPFVESFSKAPVCRSGRQEDVKETDDAERATDDGDHEGGAAR